jgi:hypothetical protein
MPAYDASLFAPPAPVAHVSLRNSDTGAVVSSVPMLIDSGADVTLIPRASASGIGAVIDSTTSYELIGFDGSVSAAHAVHLDLLFLRRAFKGQFSTDGPILRSPRPGRSQSPGDSLGWSATELGRSRQARQSMSPFQRGF